MTRLAVMPPAAALALAGCASGTPSARPKSSPPPAPAVYFLGDSYTVGVNGMPKSQTYARGDRRRGEVHPAGPAHPTAAGHLYLAERLRAGLTKRRLLPG